MDAIRSCVTPAALFPQTPSSHLCTRSCLGGTLTVVKSPVFKHRIAEQSKSPRLDTIPIDHSDYNRHDGVSVKLREHATVVCINTNPARSQMTGIRFLIKE